MNTRKVLSAALTAVALAHGPTGLGDQETGPRAPRWDLDHVTQNAEGQDVETWIGYDVRGRPMGRTLVLPPNPEPWPHDSWNGPATLDAWALAPESQSP